MSDIPGFERTSDPEEFQVGEFIAADGALGVLLGFREAEGWVGYKLHPMTAIEIVRALSGWLDDHA